MQDIIYLTIALWCLATLLVFGGQSDNPDVEYHNQWKQSIITGEAMEY